MKNSTSIPKENLFRKRTEPTNLSGAADPVTLLYLYIFNQAIMDITAFYSRKGNIESIESGKEAIRWIKKSEGTFPMVALAATSTLSDLDLDKFHQWCLRLIDEIKQNCDQTSITKIRVIHKLK